MCSTRTVLNTTIISFYGFVYFEFCIFSFYFGFNKIQTVHFAHVTFHESNFCCYNLRRKPGCRLERQQHLWRCAQGLVVTLWPFLCSAMAGSSPTISWTAAIAGPTATRPTRLNDLCRCSLRLTTPTWSSRWAACREPMRCRTTTTITTTITITTTAATKTPTASLPSPQTSTLTTPTYPRCPMEDTTATMSTRLQTGTQVFVTPTTTNPGPPRLKGTKVQIYTLMSTLE